MTASFVEIHTLGLVIFYVACWPVVASIMPTEFIIVILLSSFPFLIRKSKFTICESVFVCVFQRLVTFEPIDNFLRNIIQTFPQIWETTLEKLPAYTDLLIAGRKYDYSHSSVS
jgi:hypothetical protein